MVVIKNKDILRIIGTKIQQARQEKKYTQEYVAEEIEKSVDILRSIENGRSVGSIETIINICNILEITPNDIFAELLKKKNEIIDMQIYQKFQKLSNEDKELINIIINHINKKQEK